MFLGLRIRSKVNWVQNNTKIVKHSILCHLLVTETIQNILKMNVAFNNNLEKNSAYARASLKANKMQFLQNQGMKCLCCIFSKYHIIRQYIIIIKLHMVN